MSQIQAEKANELLSYYVEPRGAVENIYSQLKTRQLMACVINNKILTAKTSRAPELVLGVIPKIWG